MDLKPYLQRIRSEFPDLSFRKVTVPEQGMDHLVLFLDDTYVARIAKNPEYIPQFTHEVDLLSALHTQIKLPIPHYEYVSQDRTFGIYKKIHGTLLTRMGYKKMTANARRTLAKDLGLFLTELHAFPVKKARARGVALENPTEYLRKLRVEYATYVRTKITKEERHYAEEILSLSDNYAQQKHPCVMTHNDLHAIHILLDKKKRISGIIDFGDKAIGDPAKDFAGLLDIDPAFMKAVYEHYKKKDPSLLRRTLLLRKRGSLSWLAHNAKAGTEKSYARAYRQFKRIMKLKLK